MSGFEIAGLVLGAFPILCDAAKGLRGVYKDFGYWRHFEREFEDFIGELEGEHIAFWQMLDILLEPLDNITENERQALRNEPSSHLWFHPRIKDQLKHRVQEQFLDWFVRQLDGMNGALNELHSMLPLEKTRHLDSESLEREMFRIKTSFSHRKERIMSDIQNRNDGLFKFLEREQLRHLSRTSNPAPSAGSEGNMPSLPASQEQAKSIFMAFQRHWTCSCTAASHAGCISARESDVRVLLKDGNAMTHIKVEVEKRTKPSAPSTASRLSTPQVSTKHEEVTELRQQIFVKNRISLLKEKGSNRIFELAASTLSSLSNPAREDSDGSQNKPAKMNSHVPNRPKAGGAHSIQTSRVRVDPNPPLCTPVVDGTTTDVPHSNEAIDNMCMAITQKRPFLGFLEMPDAKVLLHLEPAPQRPETETLEEFMDATPRRHTRLKLGLSITFSMLKLGPCWVPENWHKSSLVLLRTTEPIPYPYISHPSIQSTLKASSAVEAIRAKTSLLTLGILLLELLFHDTLERQPFRADYLNSEGEPNNMTDFCTAIQWQTKVEAKFGEVIADVIRRCIYCAFGPAPNLGSPEFLKAIWLTVVKPLEEFLKVYTLQ